MGASSYSDAVYSTRMAHHAATGTPVFGYSADISAGRKENKVHETLDPSGKNKSGEVIRESLDSPEHPTSRAVAVLFDVTGSMRLVPEKFVNKLNKLMALLVKKGYIEHPHVLFGAIGDATCDGVPLQVGQFEAGNEMDAALTNIVLEGGGGGQNTESYELGMYFMSRHTRMDCFNKRSQKGYLFFIGDEIPYPFVKKSEVERIIGDKLQSDIGTEEILAELLDKFEVFWIIPAETNHASDPEVLHPLQTMFGQRLLKLANPEDVCELIASTIGVSEGYDIHDVAAGLKDIGADEGAIGRATNALTSYVASSSVTKGATATGSLVAAGEDKVERL